MPSTTRNKGQLGVTFAPSSAITPADVIELVALAERLGYSSYWLPETWGVDAAALLGVLSYVTSRIHLASGVFNVYSRSAGLIAQSAATLQTLSAGRFILGLGASGPGVIERWHGTVYERPVQRTREYVEAVRLALSGQRVDYDGQLVRMHDFRLSLLPPSPVPIYIAALGPRNIRMTAAVADGWLPIFAARGHMGPLRQELETGAREHGRDPNAISTAAYIPYLVGSRAERLLRQQLAYYIGGMGTFYAEFVARLGMEEDARLIREMWQTGDRVAAVGVVRDELLDICTLGTDAARARDRLSAYRGDGVDVPVIALPTGCTRQEAEETMRSLAPEDGS